MTLDDQIKKQRVKHIVSSYQLDGEDGEACTHYLDELLDRYASSLIELAFAETIAQNWAQMPMPRGIPVFEQVHALLKSWETRATSTDRTSGAALSSLNPDDFQHITGLDPSSIFEPFDSQPPPSIVRRH